MNKMEELKPCPFCGGEAAIGISDDEAISVAKVMQITRGRD